MTHSNLCIRVHSLNILWVCILFGTWTPQSSRAVVCGGLKNIPIVTGFEGTYIDIEPGMTSFSPIIEWDLSLFFGGAGERNTANFQPVRPSTDPFSRILNVASGQQIGATSIFASGEGGSGDFGNEHLGHAADMFTSGVGGHMGFQLTTGGGFRFGWIRATLQVDQDGAVVHDWAYDDSGAPILAGFLFAVPEPERSLIFLVGLALGVFHCGRSRVYRQRKLDVVLSVLFGGLFCSSSVEALDANADGVSDVFQRNFSLPEGAVAAVRDGDGDGSRDVIEFLFGTDPAHSSSIAPTKPRYDPTGFYALKQLVQGAAYGLETSTNLKTWTVAIAPAVATSTTMTFTLTPVLGERRFCRYFAPTLQPDADSDGLNVIEERLLGTSDLLADTDADGVSDSQEFINGTSPTDFFNGEVPTLVIISGDTQITSANQRATQALVVEVRRANASPWPLAPVIFTSAVATLGSSSGGPFAASLSTTVGSNGRGEVFAKMPAAQTADVPVTASCGSATITFHLIAGPPNEPPVVSFTSPVAASRFSSGNLIAFSVHAADSDPGDTVTVELYDRASLIGSATEGSGGNFAFTWATPNEGQRIVLAKATDAHGLEAWAALPIRVLAAESELDVLGPVEGGMVASIPANADDLRSNPFVRQPAFAAAIGNVSGAMLGFNEQPGWTPGMFASGYTLYVRSGAKLGALFPLAGNDVNTLTLASAAAGLAAGDLIALLPNWTLDSMLPASAVPSSSRVFVAEPTALPAMTGLSYQRGADSIWRETGGSTPASDVQVPPWSCYRVVHNSGQAATTLISIGDAAMGAVRIDLTAHSSAQEFAFGLSGPLSMTLRQSGLSDAGVMREGDILISHSPDGTMQTWQFLRRAWVSSAGGDGSSLIFLAGGAVHLQRVSPSPTTNWLQPGGQ
jgi:hypothetical protein